MIAIQCILFFIIATLQAITGLGGGTLYISALTLTDVNYIYIPVIALISNTISSSAATYFFYKKRYLSFNLIKPFLITAIPSAYIGGSINISEKIFSLILLLVMLTVAFKMCFLHTQKTAIDKKPHIILKLFLGAIAGMLSGIIGIGGAIFLVPMMYYYNLASPKAITASAVLFVLINSSFGLLGHIFKLNDLNFVYMFLPLFLSSFIGGKTGSFLTVKKIPEKNIQTITTAVILAVAVKILTDLF